METTPLTLAVFDEFDAKQRFQTVTHKQDQNTIEATCAQNQRWRFIGAKKLW